MKLTHIREAIKEQLTIEYQRYSKHLWGRLVGVSIHLLVFLGVPLGLQHLMPLMLEYMSVQLMYTIIYWSSLIGPGIVICLLMWYIYKAKIPFFEKYRIAPEKPWPWEQSPKQWRKTLLKSIFLNFVNLCTYVPFFIYSQAQIKIPYVLDVDQIPSLCQMIKIYAFLVVIEDLLNTATHRLFHAGPLYTYFHKLHHQYYTTVTIAGLHTHIVQTVFNGGIPTKIYFTITTMIFGPLHLSTAVVWNLLRMYDTYMGHSGYMFSWNPNQIYPFCANDGYHDFHHSHNCGNYGSQLRIWDVLGGSSKDFKEFRKKRQKIENIKKD